MSDHDLTRAFRTLPEPPSLDADEILPGARRRLRTRRLATTGAALALAAVVGGGAVLWTPPVNGQVGAQPTPATVAASSSGPTIRSSADAAKLPTPTPTGAPVKAVTAQPPLGSFGTAYIKEGEQEAPFAITSTLAYSAVREGGVTRWHRWSYGGSEHQWAELAIEDSGSLIHGTEAAALTAYRLVSEDGKDLPVSVTVVPGQVVAAEVAADGTKVPVRMLPIVAADGSTVRGTVLTWEGPGEHLHELTVTVKGQAPVKVTLNS